MTSNLENGREWCAKRRYPTEEIAAKVVQKLKDKGRDEARYYQCPKCKGWHTTSRK